MSSGVPVNATRRFPCPACQTVNASDARFCQKCGAALPPPPSLTRRCKRCGTDNDLQAVYCKSCGIEVARARLGLTAERADAWFKYLAEHHYLFWQLWSQRGDARRIHEKCKDFQGKTFPESRDDHMAFGIPIIAKDWCITRAAWQQKGITSGEVLGGTTDLFFNDLPTKTSWKIPYEDICVVEFVEGWHLLIKLADQTAVTLSVNLPGMAGYYVQMGLDFVAGLSGRQTLADMEASQQGLDRIMRSDNAKFDDGRAFWGSVLELLAEILEHRGA